MTDKAPYYLSPARKIILEARRETYATQAKERAADRAAADFAAAFRYDRGKTMQENQHLFAASGWTTAKTGSFWRDVIVSKEAPESWRVLVFHKPEGWKISLNPPRQSKFVMAWGPLVYDTAILAKTDALGFVKYVFEHGEKK